MACKADAKSTAQSESRALVPVTVEGWTLFDGGAGDHWVRDLDLAERAGLEKPRDIRTAIKGAIKDGSLIGAVIPGANDSPCFREVATIVTSGKGRQVEVAEFYLNELAALLIVMRLRTPKAVELTRAVARVFMAVTRGEFVGPAVMRRLGDMEAHLEINRQENLLLRAKIELLDPTANGTIGEFRANLIRGQLREAGRLYCATMGIAKTQAEIKERDNELRMHLGFPQGIEQRWEHLPLTQFGHALAKAHEIVGREKSRAKRLAPAMEQMRIGARQEGVSA